MIKHVSLAEMQERLPELAEAVEAGETVVVTRDGQPFLDLVPHRSGTGLNLAALDAFKTERGLDSLSTYVAHDFDAPLPDDFLLRPLPTGP